MGASASGFGCGCIFTLPPHSWGQPTTQLSPTVMPFTTQTKPAKSCEDVRNVPSHPPHTVGSRPRSRAIPLHRRTGIPRGVTQERGHFVGFVVFEGTAGHV